MKLKKLACLCLASVMALALAVPSFATAYDGNGTMDEVGAGNLTVTGTTQLPTIKVTVPSNSNLAVTINPYGMTVDKSAVAAGANQTGLTAKETAQIISPTYYALNYSNANVKVKVEAKGTFGGSAATDVAFSEKPIASLKSATDRLIFMYVDTAIASKDQEKITWAEFSGKATDSQVVLTGTQASPAAAATAVKTEYVLAAGDGSTGLAKNGGVLAFKVDGDANGNPDSTKAWTANDTVNVALTFTLSVTSDISTYEANQAAAG